MFQNCVCGGGSGAGGYLKDDEMNIGGVLKCFCNRRMTS